MIFLNNQQQTMHWTPPPPANLDILRTPFIRKRFLDLRVIELQCQDTCQLAVTEHVLKHFEYI